MFRKNIRKVFRRRKMQFWQQCGKKVAGSPNFSGPFTKKDKKPFFFDRNLIHYKMIICTKEMRCWQTYQNFSKSSEKLIIESQKKHGKFLSNRQYFNLKMTLCACRIQFWQRYWIFYSAKSLFFMPKVKNYRKVKLFCKY